MKRRHALKLLAASGLGFFAPVTRRGWAQTVSEPEYDGPLFLMVQANGGWDVTSFCDPKDDPRINKWALTLEIERAGNIPYAPFAGNGDLFEKYAERMLVINGIDVQTNSHDAGVIHNWSGRLEDGYPSFPAQVASALAPEMAMSYISNGGYSESAGLVGFTRVDRVGPLRKLLQPNGRPELPEANFLDHDDLQAVRSAQAARQQAALAGGEDWMPRRFTTVASYMNATDGGGAFNRFLELLPDEEDLLPDADDGLEFGSLKRQAQLALTAFRAGISMTGDLNTPFIFDTHSNHDQFQRQALLHLNRSLDYLWTAAEEFGLADRLTVFVTSDFSRTPYYNSDVGKDHWPYNSAVLMRKNAPWTNRVVGLTDPAHRPLRIDPQSLARDDSNGVVIRPGHVMKALRQLAGIDQHPSLQRFPIELPETINFF